ncbi:MAG: redoxin domain-containing protein [Planctomycetota bacterium]|jgi:peroxiredoxin
MRRKLIAVSAVLTILISGSLALAQREGGPREGDPRRPGPPGERQAARIRQQIGELKANHEALIAELRAIHAAAVNEKAPETAGKVEKLIDKRQKTFQTRMQQLERLQERVQQAMRSRMERPERPERRGRRAPDFELNSFDGRTVSLSQYKGRVVVLEWFNMECPFSKYHYETKPTMPNLAKKYKNKEVVWLAINSTNHTTPEANTAFAKKYKLPFPILDDRSGRVGRAYGARTTPHVFVIDKDGYVAYQGAIDSAPMGKAQAGATTVGYVDNALAELTTGKSVSTPATPPYGCSVKYAR